MEPLFGVVVLSRMIKSIATIGFRFGWDSLNTDMRLFRFALSAASRSGKDKNENQSSYLSIMEK